MVDMLYPNDHGTSSSSHSVQVQWSE